MDTLNELLRGIANPVTQQDGFSQPAQDASFNSAKPESVDQQRRSLPDDFILENKIFWLEGTFGKVIFQLEEWIQPLAKTREDGRSVM